MTLSAARRAHLRALTAGMKQTISRELHRLRSAAEQATISFDEFNEAAAKLLVQHAVSSLTKSTKSDRVRDRKARQLAQSLRGAHDRAALRLVRVDR